MILNFLSILMFLLFFILGIIHFYWAIGGEWGLKNVIPTKNENLEFRPSSFATLMVGVISAILAGFYMNQTDIVLFKLPKWTNSILWITPSIFLIRAIGEFKYVGFFKSIKSTLFAKWDSKLYSPLCLIASVISFIIAYLN